MSHELDEQAVRRVLGAAARPGPPMPPDVADRLDEVLSELVAGRSLPLGPTEEAGSAVVVPLTRTGGPRRRWPQVLVAAAAVSVLGLGIGNLASRPGQSETAAGGADTAVESLDDGGGQGEQGAPGAPGEETDALSGAASDPDRGELGYDGQGRGSAPRLRIRSLTVDVQRVEDFGLARATADGWRGACLRPDAPAASAWLPVRLDGVAAVLVLHPPSGGVRRAEVFTCDDASSPAASTTVDAR